MIDRTSETWLEKVRADHDNGDPHRARKAELTLEEYRARAGRRIATWINGAEVRVRIKEPALIEFLDTGVYLSLTGAGESGGASSIENREKIEEAIFGIPPGTGFESRPIYAYLEGSDEAGCVCKYGRIILRLREVSERSTFTLGDSNDATLTAVAARLAPMPLAEPSILAASSRANIVTAESVSEACEQYGGYVEVEIHGGLTLDNLVEIIYLQGAEPSNEVVELAKDHWPVRTVLGHEI